MRANSHTAFALQAPISAEQFQPLAVHNIVRCALVQGRSEGKLARMPFPGQQLADAMRQGPKNLSLDSRGRVKRAPVMALVLALFSLLPVVATAVTFIASLDRDTISLGETATLSLT